MTNIQSLIDALTLEQMATALPLLDALSRPLTAREIERALIGKGISRTQRVIVAGALKHFHIVAVIGAEP